MLCLSGGRRITSSRIHAVLPRAGTLAEAACGASDACHRSRGFSPTVLAGDASWRPVQQTEIPQVEHHFRHAAPARNARNGRMPMVRSPLDASPFTGRGTPAVLARVQCSTSGIVQPAACGDGRNEQRQ